MQNEDEVQAAFTRRSHYMLGNLSEEDLRRRMSQISQVYWHRRRQEEYLEVLEDTAVEIWANSTVVLRWHNTIQGQHIPIQLRAEWLRNLPDQACHVHFLPDGVGLSSVQNGVQTPIIAAENTAEQGIWARGGNRRRFGTVPYALDLERFWQLERARISGRNVQDMEAPGRPLARGVRDQRAFQLPTRPEDALYPFQQWVDHTYPERGGFTTLHPARK